MSLIAECCVSSDVDSKNYLQMTDECFNVLLHLLKLHIEKQNIRIKRAINAEEKLTATSRFLAMGQSFEDLQFATIISPLSSILFLVALAEYYPNTTLKVLEFCRRRFLTIYHH
jgi:hypothetical protein